MSKKKEIKSEEGVCPNCGGTLEYGSSEPCDGMFMYEVECEECEYNGEEWYTLEFSGHSE